MPLFPSLAYGIRLLSDTGLRVSNPGRDTYLRVKKFPTVTPPSTDEAVELGFRVSTEVAAEPAFEDILIDPPVEANALSYRNVEKSMGRLVAGAHSFRISHTFVLKQIEKGNLNFQYDVFNKKDYVIGIVYDDQLFSIESVSMEQQGGEPTFWMVTGNTIQKKVAK